MTDRPAADPGREDLIRADIADVARQLDEGELDRETADLLTARYRAELASLAGEAGGAPREKPSGPSRSRVIAGTVIMVGLFAAAAAGAWLAVGIGDRAGGPPGGEPVDLAQVTNAQMEAVIAANPDLPEIAGMRLALADRYFEVRDFSTALPHYLGALEGTLDAARRARALARVGWMSHQSGAPDVARRYLDEAQATDPGYGETRLFLGLLLLEEDDPEGALRQLEPLLAGGELPDDLRPIVEGAAEAARARVEDGG